MKAKFDADVLKYFPELPTKRKGEATVSNVKEQKQNYIASDGREYTPEHRISPAEEMKYFLSPKEKFSDVAQLREQDCFDGLGWDEMVGVAVEKKDGMIITSFVPVPTPVDPATDSIEGVKRPDFRAMAKKIIQWGGHVVPCIEGSKITHVGAKKGTRDLVQVEAWGEENPHYNCANVGNLDGNVILDDDSGIIAEYEALHGKLLTTAILTVSGGRQLTFRHTEASRRVKNLKGIVPETKEELWSLRGDNQYGMMAGSTAHPNNDESKPLATYKFADGGDIAPIPIPDALVEFLQEQVGANETGASRAAQTETAAGDAKWGKGGRNNALSELVRKCKSWGMNKEEITAFVHRINDEKCDPPLPRNEVSTIIESNCRYNLTGGLDSLGVHVGSSTNPTDKVQVLDDKGSVVAEGKRSALKFNLPKVTGTDFDFVFGPEEDQKDGWFPRDSVSIVCGTSGGGKTTYLVQLILAQARRESVEGHPSFGLPFLVLQMDRGKGSDARTRRRLGVTKDDYPTETLTPLKRTPEQLAQLVIDKMEARQKETGALPAIVVIEGGDIGAGGSLFKWDELIYYLLYFQLIAEYYHTAVLMTFGVRKLKKGESFVSIREYILGPGYVGRMVETVMAFFKDDKDNNTRLLKVDRRNGPPEEYRLKFSRGLLERDLSLSGKVAALNKAEMVEGWCRMRPGWFAVKDCCAETGVSIRYAQGVISDLVRAGVLNKKTGPKAASKTEFYRLSQAEVIGPNARAN